MSREEKSNMMISLAQQWQQSGQSQVAFARENNINVFTLRYWIDKSRHEVQGSSSFIQINAPGGAPVCLRYPNGVELLLPVNIPVGFIKDLIHFF
jgi:hypothetical protein